MLTLFRCEELVDIINVSPVLSFDCEEGKPKIRWLEKTAAQVLCGSERLAKASLDQAVAFSAGTCHVRGIAGRFQFLSSALRDGEIVTVTLGG